MTESLDVLAYESSPIGMIGLRRRPHPSEPGTIVTELTLDHEFLMSSHNTVSERALARRAIELHGDGALSVLVGGLGLGYTAHEALASDRVAEVRVVEYLPQVIGWLDRGLLPLSDELTAEPRLRVVEDDFYALLSAPAQTRYDVIAADVDHSPEEHLGATSDGFYTEAGLVRAKRHLRPGGVLGVWSHSESPNFARTLRQVFDEVQVEPLTFVNPVLLEEETNWLFFGRA